MCLRIDAITEDTDLMRVINSTDSKSTLKNVLETDRKVIITVFGANENTILLFCENESTRLLFWQNEKMILLLPR